MNSLTIIGDFERFLSSRANIGILGAGSSRYIVCGSLSRTLKVSLMLLLIEPIIKKSYKIWRVIFYLTMKKVINLGDWKYHKRLSTAALDGNLYLYLNQ